MIDTPGEDLLAILILDKCNGRPLNYSHVLTISYSRNVVLETYKKAIFVCNVISNSVIL